MNKVLAERSMKKLSQLSFDQLMMSEQELLDEINSVGLTPELIQKVYSLNFVIVLSVQNRSISFAEYAHLVHDLSMDVLLRL